MTDSSSTPPLRPNILVDPTRSGSSESRPNLIIISLPSELQNTKTSITVEGKIIESKSDGTVRIQTEQGEIVAKADRAPSITNGQNIEIRLPKGSPPETATLRTTTSDRPKKNDLQNQPTVTAPNIQKPTSITVKEFVETVETINLKNIPPQQIYKVIVPYQNTTQTALEPSLTYISKQAVLDLIQSNIPSITEQNIPVQNGPIQQKSFFPAAPSISLPLENNALQLPITIKQTHNAAKTPPEYSLPDIAGQENLSLITPSQGLLDFLKNQGSEKFEKAKLAPLPLEIPARSLLPGLFSKPLLDPVTTPKFSETEILNQQISLSDTRQPIFPANTVFEILSLTPPMVIQHIPTNEISATSAPEQKISEQPLNVMSANVPNEFVLQTATYPMQMTTENAAPASDKITSSLIQNLFLGSDILPTAKDNDRLIHSIITEPRIDSFHAIVVGYTPEQNFPVLQIIKPEARDHQFFALELPVRDIPLGTQIELRPDTTTSLQLPIASTLLTAPTVTNNQSTTNIWTALQEIQTSLAQISPQLAQNFNAILPQITNPQQFGATTLFFLAALRSGDVTGWIGEKAVEALKKSGKGELLSRLATDFSTLRATETSSAEWRSTTLPLQLQNEIYKTIIHYKNDGKEQNQEEKKGGGTRFLMNLTLSQIGPLQLDGLFQADKKRLDLALRTKTSFSIPIQEEMRRIYKSSLDEIQYTGDLLFQSKAEHWVHIKNGTQPQYQKHV